jgi:hypothetical protein
MFSAGAIGILMLMLGIGNLVDPDDTGPLYGQLILLAVMATGTALIVFGLVLVPRNEALGCKLVSLGVLPGSVGIAFFWFLPAVAVGVLALATSWVAFQSGQRLERETAAS